MLARMRSADRSALSFDCYSRHIGNLYVESKARRKAPSRLSSAMHSLRAYSRKGSARDARIPTRPGEV